MATLDFVVSHPSAPALNALPITARTVTLHVPDSLDPYHQQQLRDALEGAFRQGSQAIAAEVDAKEKGCEGLRDKVAARMGKLQASLEQSATQWLAKWSGSNQPSAPLSDDDRAVVDQAEQEMRVVLALVKQAQSFNPGPNRSEGSARRLGNELDARLGRLSGWLQAVLELPARGKLELEDTRREALIQQLLEAIHAGQAAATNIRRAEL